MTKTDPLSSTFPRTPGQWYRFFATSILLRN